MQVPSHPVPSGKARRRCYIAAAGGSATHTGGRPRVSKFRRIELMTSDASGALGFYRRTFGWRAELVEASLDGGVPYYWLIGQDGADVGGLYAMSEDLRRDGVPPHWLPHI